MRLSSPSSVLALSLLALITCNASVAQDAPPGTDIWLLDIQWSEDGISLGEARNITARTGYDSQPMFSPEGDRIWYTRINDQGVADIWYYDRNSDSLNAFTQTETSEYSPTPTPDNQGISVIRVIDGKQWLYKLPLDHSQAQLLLPEVEPVGYHTWLSENELALFVLGEPHTLQLVKLGQEARVVAEDIGRGLKTVPGSNKASYLDVSAEPWTIRLANPENDQTEPLITGRAESQDFVWADNGWLLMGQGSVLWGRSPGSDSWQQLADLEPIGISDISRIAVSPGDGSLAVVGTDPAP